MIINDILKNTIRVRKTFTDTDNNTLTDVDNIKVSIARGGVTLASFTTASTGALDLITVEAVGVVAIKLATGNTSIYASGGSYVIYTDCAYEGDTFRSRDTLNLRS